MSGRASVRRETACVAPARVNRRAHGAGFGDNDQDCGDAVETVHAEPRAGSVSEGALRVLGPHVRWPGAA